MLCSYDLPSKKWLNELSTTIEQVIVLCQNLKTNIYRYVVAFIRICIEITERTLRKYAQKCTLYHPQLASANCLFFSFIQLLISWFTSQETLTINKYHTGKQCLNIFNSIAYDIHSHIGGMMLRSAGNDPYHVARTALRTTHIFPHITHNNAE